MITQIEDSILREMVLHWLRQGKTNFAIALMFTWIGMFGPFWAHLQN